MADSPINDIATNLKDAAYVAIGFGVIAFQKAQVRRRELGSQFTASTEQVREQLNKLAGETEERMQPVVEAFESSLDQVEEALPEAAREYFKQARTTAKDAGEQVRARFVEIAKTTTTV